MSLPSVVFVSAVSRELSSARQPVANTLTFLEYEPDWQDVSVFEQGDLLASLAVYCQAMRERKIRPVGYGMIGTSPV
ncbi:MAG TPA: hypothetical protein VK673_06975 [Chthoniobacterales bacterium]|nr:hypothetical protein [Chthoniobacterales bacterium]